LNPLIFNRGGILPDKLQIIDPPNKALRVWPSPNVVLRDIVHPKNDFRVRDISGEAYILTVVLVDRPQLNRLRPNEIGYAFHGINI
jgi:hypothetical protein